MIGNKVANLDSGCCQCLLTQYLISAHSLWLSMFMLPTYHSSGRKPAVSGAKVAQTKYNVADKLLFLVFQPIT